MVSRTGISGLAMFFLFTRAKCLLWESSFHKTVHYKNRTPGTVAWLMGVQTINISVSGP